MIKLRITALTVIILLSLNACAYWHSQKNLEAKITSSPQLNPDLNERASPIVLSFYQLKTKLPFKTLSYEHLSHNPYAHLKSSLIDFTSVELQPAQQRHLNINVNSKALYLGVVAAYRKLDKATWRKIIELPNNNYYLKLKINLSKQQLITQLD